MRDTGLDIFFNAARDFSARYSCRNPRKAFNTTTASIASASPHSFKKPDMTAAAISTQMMKLLN